MNRTLPERIFICGFMGTGKSTAGKALAGRLEVPFHDLDDYISEKAGMGIPEIFDSEGEECGFCLETDLRPRTVNKNTLPPHPSVKKEKEELYQRPLEDFIDFTDSFDGPPYSRTSPEGTKKLE